MDITEAVPIPRVFVALAPVTLSAGDLAGIRSAFAPWGQKIRWYHPADLHLTLAFIGDLHPDMLDPLQQACLEVAAKNAGFSMPLDRTGYFPGAERAKVIFLGSATACPALTALQSDLAQSLKECRISFDDRPFVPHITVARPAGRYPLDLSSADDLNRDLPVQVFSLLHIMKRSDSPAVRYQTIFTCPLKRPEIPEK